MYFVEEKILILPSKNKDGTFISDRVCTCRKGIANMNFQVGG